MAMALLHKGPMRIEAAVVSSVKTAKIKMFCLFTNESHVHGWQRIHNQFAVTGRVKYKIYEYSALERLRARNVL